MKTSYLNDGKRELLFFPQELKQTKKKENTKRNKADVVEATIAAIHRI